MASAQTENSTNVRTSTRLLQGAFRTFGRVAPDAASRVMVQLMGRTARGTPSARAARHLTQGQRFTVAGLRGRLRGWTFGEGPAVLLVHGWNGRATQLTDFVPGLVEAGFRAVLYDQPGHGESDGNMAHVGLFAEATRAVGRVVGPVHAVIAHSLGAAGAAVAQHRDALGARRLVLLAPSARPIEYVRAFARDYSGSPEHAERFIARLTDTVGLTEADLDVPAFGLTAPSLVVHDRADDDVPFEAAQAIVQGWPGATLLATDGLGHRRLLRDPEVVRAAVDFVTLGVLPERPWGGPLLQPGA